MKSLITCIVLGITLIARAQPTIIISPQPGDTLYVGQTNTIQWQAQTNYGSKALISLSDDYSGSGQWIAYGVPNTGSYSWVVSKVGNALNSTTHYTIKVQQGDWGPGGVGSYYPSAGTVSVIITNGPPPLDLSMLTNHAALVAYCFKQVQGISVNVSCGSQVTSQGQRFYSYTNAIKTLDGIMSAFTNDWWNFQVTSPTDYFTISVSFYNTNDWNTIQNNQWYNQNSSMMFSGGQSSQPVQNQWGQWTLPISGETVPMYLNPNVKIRVPKVDGDSFFFNSQYAGNGTIVLSGWKQTSPNSYQWFQTAVSLQNGLQTQLTSVELQVLVTGSGDFVSYKGMNDLTTFIWTWTDYNGNEYGTVPLEIATFDQPTTNVVLHTYTSNGQSASSFVLENQATKARVTVTVPKGFTGINLGTNVLNGVYYIIPVGINLQSAGYYGGGYGKGVVAIPVAATN
jgi:hypothetical protein